MYCTCILHALYLANLRLLKEPSCCDSRNSSTSSTCLEDDSLAHDFSEPFLSRTYYMLRTMYIHAHVHACPCTCHGGPSTCTHGGWPGRTPTLSSTCVPKVLLKERNKGGHLYDHLAMPSQGAKQQLGSRGHTHLPLPQAEHVVHEDVVDFDLGVAQLKIVVRTLQQKH